MVRTPSGDVPIEKLKVGDLVETPFGPSPVGICRKNLASAMARIETSDGSSLVGTARHKVFTWNQGWVRMDSLSLTSAMESVTNIHVWKHLNSSSTPVKPIGFKQLVDTTKMGTSLQPSDFYTGSSGLRILDQFQTESTSTTKTTTGLITTLKTFSCLLRQSIRNITGKLNGNSIKCALKKWSRGDCGQSSSPRHGTPQKKGWLGTPITEEGHGTIEPTPWPSAAYAAMSSSPRSRAVHLCAQHHAQTDVLPKKGLLSKGRALFARLHSSPREEAPRPVPLSVVPFTATEPVEVYNLTLHDHNAYYANGLLVQNCMMLVHVVRKNSDVIPGLVEQQQPAKQGSSGERLRFLSVKEMVTVDQADSIDMDGKDEY
jgi:hypothetical protein